MVAQCERATPRPEARRASSQACSCSSLPWRPLGAARRNPQPPSLRCAHGTDASRRARPPPGAPSGEHASPPPRARQPRARVCSSATCACALHAPARPAPRAAPRTAAGYNTHHRPTTAKRAPSRATPRHAECVTPDGELAGRSPAGRRRKPISKVFFFFGGRSAQSYETYAKNTTVGAPPTVTGKAPARQQVLYKEWSTAFKMVTLYNNKRLSDKLMMS